MKVKHGEGLLAAYIAMTPSGEAWRSYEVPSIGSRLIHRLGAQGEAAAQVAVTAAIMGQDFHCGEVMPGSRATVIRYGDFAVKIFRPWDYNDPPSKPELSEGLTCLRALTTFEAGVRQLRALADAFPSPPRQRFTTPQTLAAVYPNVHGQNLGSRVHVTTFEEGKYALPTDEGENGPVPNAEQRIAVYHAAVELAGVTPKSIYYDDVNRIENRGAPRNVLLRPLGDRGAEVVEIIKFDVMATGRLYDQAQNWPQPQT